MAWSSETTPPARNKRFVVILALMLCVGAYREQKPEQVEEYLEEIEGLTDDHIAYVDETGIDNYLYREYGWAERGKPVMGIISGRRFRRTGIVAAQMGKSIVAPLQYDGTMDSILSFCHPIPQT